LGLAAPEAIHRPAMTKSRRRFDSRRRDRYMPRMTDALLVFTTLPTPEKAADLARMLVEEGLVACGNVLPAVRSIYKWEGKVQDENEVMLLLKTRAEHLERLKLRILEVHPYEVPEVLAIPVESGYRAYLEWIASETK
jgi:periplasmic divalent cation tolerance protein